MEVAAKLRSRRKKIFLGPRFAGKGIPQISDIRFKSHSLPSMWSVLVSSVQRVRRVADENKIEEGEGEEKEEEKDEKEEKRTRRIAVNQIRQWL